MTVRRCPGCRALWVHTCGPAERFSAIASVCPDCIAKAYPVVSL